jgi:hypothetical protein
MRLSHANHSIYRELIALLRHQTQETHKKPDQEPFQQLKKLPQLKPKEKRLSLDNSPRENL